MSLKLIHTDLTRFPCDAAVFPADESLQAGGSVFGACLSAAGPSLKEALREIGSCAVGTAQSIECPDFLHRVRFGKLIVTAAPVWQDGAHNETALLAQCYQSSLDEAVRLGCKTIGISLIDSGVYGFPKDTALETAVQSILAYPQLSALDVFLISFDWHSYGDHANRTAALERYISRTMQNTAPVAGMICGTAPAAHAFRPKADRRKHAMLAADVACESAVSLDDRLKLLDESFSQMLLRKIDEAGIKDSACYKKANVSKQLFSKIRSDPHYRPKKETVLAFALALELDLDETAALLRTAGYSLSHSSKFDIIIEYFIGQQIYNVFLINEALYQYDQPVLGSE